MTQLNGRSLVLALCLAIGVAGCGKRSQGNDEHAGHNHAQNGQEQSAAHEHEGHSHAESQSANAREEAAFCGEHNVPEAQCGICQPQLVAGLAPGESLKVRLPSERSAAAAGVEIGSARQGASGEGIEVFAELTFNQNALAQVATPVGGIVQKVLVDLGEQVKEDQTVATIWSAQIGEVVAKAVLTHQNLERERKMREQRVNSQRDLEQAEAEHRAACQQARTYGFSEDQIDSFGDKADEPVMLEVRAPFAGEIVNRTAVRGALVEPGRSLFTVVDRSTMWATLNLPESVLGRVAPGQQVELRVDSLPGRTFPGKLVWVSAEVDEKTRMATARAEVKNTDGMLKARMFARARIVTSKEDQALLLPVSAIQRVDGKPLVFVKVAPDLYEARVVRVGEAFENSVQVYEGLNADEEIVTGNSFGLKSQLLLSRLGAGCAHE